MAQSLAHSFFGRSRELASLTQALVDSEQGKGRVVWISGEPGIGKTRLAEELRARAAGRGATVAFARCIDSGLAPPYWPWAEVVRTLSTSLPKTTIRLTASCVQRLGMLVPDLLPERTRRSRATDASVAFDQYQLFDAVRTLLLRATARAPVTVIIDDVHHADPGSLLLLEFVVRELCSHRLFVVVCCRSDEASGLLTETEGELARLGLRKIVLAGLDRRATGQLLRHAAGHACPEPLVREVHERTSGNPFYITEIAQLDSADRRAIPETVRVALRRRLQRLSGEATQLLTVGAVLGREFDYRMVAAIVRARAGNDLLDAVDELLDRLLIEPVPEQSENWYRFRHALVRDAVYESLSPSRRAYWHAAIVDRMERELGAYLEDHATEVAYHAARAEALVGPQRVARYARAAGEWMLTTHAFDQALGQFERAWRAWNAHPSSDGAGAILTGLGLAQAATTVRWNRQLAWSTVQRAVEFYVSTGEITKAVTAVTHASLSAEGVTGMADVVGRLLPLVAEGSREAALLLARGAAAAYFERGAQDLARQSLAGALALASAHRDEELELQILAQCISVDHFALLWDDVLENSRRVLSLATATADLHRQAYAHYRAAFVLTHTGRTDEAKAQVEQNLAVAERLRDRGLLADALYVKALLAQMCGQWGEARADSDRGLTLASGHLPLLHARATLECETGNDRESRMFTQRLVDADRDAKPYPLAGVFTAITVSQCAYISEASVDIAPAARAIREVLANSFAARNAVVSARMAKALLAVRARDTDGCTSDLEALTSFESAMPTQWGVSTSRLLGLLAHAAGQKRRALEHFNRAVTFCRAAGFVPELARSCHDYAVALMERASRDDRARAAALLAEGEHLASSLRLAPLLGRIIELRERYRLRLERKPAGLTVRELEVLQLLADGKANREIAEQLFISTHTVAIHVTRVLEKTGSKNRTAAVTFATRHHLLG